MWYVIKMCISVFVTVAITFTVAISIQNETHKIWFPLFNYGTVYLTFTTWYVITIGAYVMIAVFGYYAFRIGTYYYRKHKNKKKKL